MKRDLPDGCARILMAAIDAQPLGDNEDVDAEIVNAIKGRDLVKDADGKPIRGSWLNIEPKDAGYTIRDGQVNTPKLPGYPRVWQWKPVVTFDLDATQAKLVRGWVQALKGEKGDNGRPLLTRADAPEYRELLAYLADCERGAEVRALGEDAA